MDDLTKICCKLEECSRRKVCCCDEIVCTKKFLKIYIGDEYNKLLRLKVELKNSYESEKMLLPNWSIVLSSIALCLSIVGSIYGSRSVEYRIVALASLIMILVMKIGERTKPKEVRARKKWRNYIEIVLEEMEKSR